MRTPVITPDLRINNNYIDYIRSTIINKINNEIYNSYFPVSGYNDSGERKEKKRKAVIILPRKNDEL